MSLLERRASLDNLRVRGVDLRLRKVKREGGCKIRVCGLPVKAPWLNPIEPKWVHGKRRIVEPARLLSAEEIATRVCAWFGCVHEPHLTLTKEVS